MLHDAYKAVVYYHVGRLHPFLHLRVKLCVSERVPRKFATTGIAPATASSNCWHGKHASRLAPVPS